MHADTSFHNGSGASTKWCETTKNMSFGPKVVDWACSLLENKKWFWRQLGMVLSRKQETVLEAKTRALNAPRYRFLQRIKCGYEMAWNHPKHEF